MTSHIIKRMAIAIAAIVLLPIASASAQKDPATTTLAGGAYDSSALDAQVREAVESARAADARATTVAEQARAAAALGEAAATNASNGVDGYGASDRVRDDVFGSYLGAWSNDTANGQGALEFREGQFAGDRYVGDFVDGRFQGTGVYSWSGANAGSRYEGAFSDVATGAGVFHFADGGRYSGDNVEWHSSGYGVMYRADGSRYEGEWFNDQRNGFGVEWDAQGRIVAQGRFSKDAFTSDLGQ